MNQADVFYYSGHGDFATGGLQSKASLPVYGFTPQVVGNRWRADLDCVVFAGCSVLNIGDFRAESFVNVRTRIKYWFRKQQSNNGGSPGLLWEGVGPDYLLGYCWTAPLDNQGAAQVAQTFASEINSGSDPVEAWRNANDRNACRNACVIDCSQTPHKFWYWSETTGTAVWTNKVKGVTSW